MQTLYHLLELAFRVDEQHADTRPPPRASIQCGRRGSFTHVLELFDSRELYVNMPNRFEHCLRDSALVSAF